MGEFVNSVFAVFYGIQKFLAQKIILISLARCTPLSSFELAGIFLSKKKKSFVQINNSKKRYVYLEAGETDWQVWKVVWSWIYMSAIKGVAGQI